MPPEEPQVIVSSSRVDPEKPKETSPLLASPEADSTPQRLSLTVKAAYGTGHVFNDICASMWFSYTLLFLQVVQGMPALLAGGLLATGQVADALTSPLIGWGVDRWASRKIWHLCGTVIIMISFPLMFAPCLSCTTHLAYGLYYAFLIILFQCGWAIVQISHMALITDLTTDKKERAELTAIRYTATVCASTTVYIITWVVLHVTKQNEADKIGPGDEYKFRNVVLIGIGIGILSTVWFHFGLRNTGNSSSQRLQSAASERLDPHAMREYFTSPALYQVAMLYVTGRLFLTISLVYMPLYLDESLSEGSESYATVPLVSYIASLVASLSMKYTHLVCGNKTIYFLGGIISILGCVWIRYGHGEDYINNQIYGVAILLGAGSSITIVSSLCLTADLIGTKTHTGAFVYSVVTFSDKLLNGVAILIIGKLECPSVEICPHFYRDVMSLACGWSAVAGLLVLLTLVPRSTARDFTQRAMRRMSR